MYTCVSISLSSLLGHFMKIGYARVSTQDQTLDVQLEQLKRLGCEKFTKSKRAVNLLIENSLTCCWILQGREMLFMLPKSTALLEIPLMLCKLPIN
uniref:Resolvase/invertase-type recombinase catalytic domain-containing protein n=1 Tax=Vibrio sp. FF_286 TaxID=1652831 RepID=A0A0H3ZSS2_9VIBR|nr:hypothetical protein [Vibrio sp. FF_286]